jgi:hypothetical protein
LRKRRFTRRGGSGAIGFAVFLALIAALVILVPGAAATVAPGSLNCPTLDPGNPVKYDLEVGTTVTCTIEGASDATLNDDGFVDVWVKSSNLGNTLLQGTLSGTTITFEFTAPEGGCFTTIVSYTSLGNNSNNDFINDGLANGNGNASAGFRYVDGDGNVVTDCGGGGHEASATTVVTEIHLEPNDDVVGGSTHVDLGSTVHDKATVTADDLAADTPQGTVDWEFYGNLNCDSGDPAGSLAVDSNGVAHPSDSEGPLGAGDYSFKAFFTSDDPTKWDDGESLCEPLTVDKGDTTTATEIHLANETVVGTSIILGQSVHDKATVSGQVSGVSLGGTVTFTFYRGGDCTTGTADTLVPADTVALDSNGVAHPSPSKTPTTVGSYAFQAHYNGDNNYNASTSPCEPFNVFRAPLTPGYWKNHLTSGSPNTNQYLPQCLGGYLTLGPVSCNGGYLVDNTTKATAVWNAMNCSNTGSNNQLNQNAIGCLAGHLLATKLNLANGSDTCIQPVVTKANTFLTNPPATLVTYGVYSATSIHYTGPTGNYTLIGIPARNLAIALKSALDKYNNGGGC